MIDTAASDALSVVDLGAGCQNPGGLAEHEGTLWVACGASGALVPVDVSGAAPVVGEAVPTSPIFAPGNIAFCGGIGYLTDQWSGSVLRFDPAGLAAPAAGEICPLNGPRRGLGLGRRRRVRAVAGIQHPAEAHFAKRNVPGRSLPATCRRRPPEFDCRPCKLLTAAALALWLLAPAAPSAPAAGEAAARAERPRRRARAARSGSGPRPTAPPRRVVVLAPSLTDVVLALGLGDRLVGVTQLDDAPEVKHLPRVGGFLDPNPEAILGLRPDLVLWVSDGGALAAVRRLAELAPPRAGPSRCSPSPSWTSPTCSPPRASSGTRSARPEAGARLAARLAAQVDDVRRRAASLRPTPGPLPGRPRAAGGGGAGELRRRAAPRSAAP